MTDPRPWTHAALFGGLWGAIEALAGTAFKMVPGLPAGPLLAAAGVVCMVTARRLAPAPGVTLAAGLTALLIMAFSLGGLRPGSLIGVLAQAVAMEVALTVSGSRWGGAVVGGALAISLAVMQRVVMVLVMTGPEAAWAVLAYGQSLLDAVGILVAPQAVLGGLAGLGALAGALIGMWAWRLGGRVARRTGDVS